MAAGQCINAQEEDENGNVGDKVSFVNIDEKYCVNHDIHVAYRLADTFEPSSTDWVGILPLNWNSLTQRLSFQWVPKDPIEFNNSKEWRLKFPATDLMLADHQRSYQLTYVTLASKVLGHSRPFWLSCRPCGHLHTGSMVDEIGLECMEDKSSSVTDVSVKTDRSGNQENGQRTMSPSPKSIKSAASGDHSDHSIKTSQREEESGDGSEIEISITTSVERRGFQTGRGDEDSEELITQVRDEMEKVQDNSSIPETTQQDVKASGEFVQRMTQGNFDLDQPQELMKNKVQLGDGSEESKDMKQKEIIDLQNNSREDRMDRPFVRQTSTNTLRTNHRDNKPVKIPRSVARTVRRSRPVEEVSVRQESPIAPAVIPSRKISQDRHSCSHLTTSSPSLDVIIDMPPERNIHQYCPKHEGRPPMENDVDSHTPVPQIAPMHQTSDSELNLKPKVKKVFIATVPKEKELKTRQFVNGIELENDEGDPLKTESNSEQLVAYVLRYLAEHRPDPSSNEIIKPCRICGHLAMELSAMRWRTAQVEYREKALVLQMLKMSKHFRQQEELLGHLQQISQDNADLAKINDRLRQQVSNMKDVLLTNHKLIQEKENLEKRVGDLMWEKAALCSKVQMQQQGEVRVARRAAELNIALMEAQEEVHQLASQQQLLQRFVDGLLATLSGMGFTAVTDPGGRRLLLDIPGVQGLELEPIADTHINVTKKPRRCRPTDKWYKAMLAAQEETIHRLQEELRVWESARGNHQASATTIHQLQRALHAEMERNRNLERQTQQITRLLAQATQSVENHTNGRESKRSCDHDKPRLVREQWLGHEQSTGGSDYLSQGARPKTQVHGRRSWDVSSPDEAEGDTGMTGSQPCKLEYVTAEDSTEDLTDCCPHCKEPFTAQLSLESRQEHMRMHMYSELKNEQEDCQLLATLHPSHYHQV